MTLVIWSSALTAGSRQVHDSTTRQVSGSARLKTRFPDAHPLLLLLPPPGTFFCQVSPGAPGQQLEGRAEAEGELALTIILFLKAWKGMSCRLACETPHTRGAGSAGQLNFSLPWH